MYHNPQIDSIYKQGSNGAGVLLLHGFTGTPDSLRPVINELHKNGFTVFSPLLDGHGTTPRMCAETGWENWFNTTQKAYIDLHEKCSKIFVCGLSLGSLLALKLAIDFPQSISAIGCLATPLTLKTWVRKLLPLIWLTPLKKIWTYQKKIGVDIKDPSAKKNFWNYNLMPLSCIVSIMNLQEVVRESLAKVQTPTLLIHSRHDSTAPYESMNQVAEKISSSITETVTLENSYHIITLDYEKEIVARKVKDFFQRFL